MGRREWVQRTSEHKKLAVEKLEHYNALEVIAAYEKLQGSPQKSPQ